MNGRDQNFFRRNRCYKKSAREIAQQPLRRKIRFEKYLQRKLRSKNLLAENTTEKIKSLKFIAYPTLPIENCEKIVISIPIFLFNKSLMQNALRRNSRSCYPERNRGEYFFSKHLFNKNFKSFSASPKGKQLLTNLSNLPSSPMTSDHITRFHSEENLDKVITPVENLTTILRNKTEKKFPLKNDMRNGDKSVAVLIKKETWLNSFIFEEKDNVRFVILAIIILIYMSFGAIVFSILESTKEDTMKSEFRREYQEKIIDIENSLKVIVENNQSNVTLEKIKNLMFMWGNASENNIITNRKTWDFGGSFHFTFTVVSTLGFGAAAPRTTGGRLFLICYGFIGCSLGFLFFNLFLERIITLIDVIMRRRYANKSNNDPEGGSRPHEQRSVYWIVFFLSFLSIIIAFLASFMYMAVEDWSYLNSFYFCFVTFSTIGFGDLVSTQHEFDYYAPLTYFYHFGNFVVMIVGCSCLYSLFNVMSLVIKQFLNYIIKKFVNYTDSRRYNSTTNNNDNDNNNHNNKQVSDNMTKSNGFKNEVVHKTEEGALSTESEKEKTVFSVQNYYNSYDDNKETVEKQFSRKSTRETMSGNNTNKPFREGSIPGQVGPLAIVSSKLLPFDDSDF